MNLDEYRVHRRRAMNYDLNLSMQRINAALGLGEAGEVQGIIKKELFHDHAEDPYKVLDEAGDLIFYLDWLLETYDWTIENAMNANVAKLAERFPNGFDPARSRLRDRQKESEAVSEAVQYVARHESL